MDKAWKLLLKTALIPARIAIWTKEDCTAIVICTVNFPAKTGKMNTDFAAD
jgi:hypothetical protein